MAVSKKSKSATSKLQPIRVIINNPFMNGIDGYQAPPGFLVTGVRCSKGVGGTYARDGISELELTLSHISSFFVEPAKTRKAVRKKVRRKPSKRET